MQRQLSLAAQWRAAASTAGSSNSSVKVGARNHKAAVRMMAAKAWLAGCHCGRERGAGVGRCAERDGKLAAQLQL